MLTVLIALGVCIIETLVIVVASPLAKPSLVLRFLPEDVRIAAKDHKEPSKGRQILSMMVAGLFILLCK